MTLHRNARTCPESRELLARRVLDQGWTLTAAAEAAGVSVPTARKWVADGREASRFRIAPRPRDGWPTAPRAIGSRRCSPATDPAHRRADRRAAGDGALDGVADCKREGLGRLPRLEPLPPERRYERKRVASWSTSTSRSWDASSGSGTASRAAARPTIGLAEQAGITSTCWSTTRLGSPTPRCSPTSTRRPRSPFFAAPSPTSPRSESRSSG